MQMVGKCDLSNSGRFMMANWGNDGIRMDVSACNVLSGGADIVYLPWDQVVYVGRDNLGVVGLIALGVISVYLAILLAHNLEYVLKSNDRRVRIEIVEIVLLALAFIVMYGDGKGDPLACYITTEDRIAFIFILFYTAYYIVRGVIGVAVDRGYIVQSTPNIIGMDMLGLVDMPINRSPVNPVVAGLVMVSMRVHQSLDNSYTVAGAWMVCTRLLNKISTQSQSAPGKGFWSFFLIDVVLDSLLLSVLVFVGVLPYYARDPMITSMFVMQGVVLAVVVDLIMQTFELQSPAPPSQQPDAAQKNWQLGWSGGWIPTVRPPPLRV